jgi:dihydrodipicolinate synthase/N-acetylneuraminate lyase
MMGLIEEEYRLPLVPMSEKNRETLRTTMKAVGVLK